MSNVRSHACLSAIGLVLLGIVAAESAPWPEFDPDRERSIRVVGLGDSIVWGQGLFESDKFFYTFSDMIACMSGVSVEKTLLAHSGATIRPDDTPDTGRQAGEIPNTYPTVTQQCDEFSASPETVDLVIMDGGINDVGVTWILDPTISTDVISARTRQYCFSDMTTLLERVTTKFPSARIVVTGYYAIVTEDTPGEGLDAVLIGLGLLDCGLVCGVLGGVAADWMRESITQNCTTFAIQSNTSLREAVGAINSAALRRGEKARVFFADPQFASRNAVFASDSWLYGLRTDAFPLTHWLDPVDPLASFRESQCPSDLGKCLRASLGHPSPRGARAYASAIADALGWAWVDFTLPCCGDGFADFPFPRLSSAINLLPPGGIVWIKSSGTAERIEISKPCRLQACGGPAVIGRSN